MYIVHLQYSYTCISSVLLLVAMITNGNCASHLVIKMDTRIWCMYNGSLHDVLQYYSIVLWLSQSIGFTMYLWYNYPNKMYCIIWSFVQPTTVLYVQSEYMELFLNYMYVHACTDCSPYTHTSVPAPKYMDVHVHIHYNYVQ